MNNAASEDVLVADRALVAAVVNGDSAAIAALLDTHFNWVDAAGRVITAMQALPPAPLGIAHLSS